MFHNWRDLTRQESQKIQNSDLECVFNTLFITSTWAWKVISGLIFSPAGSKKGFEGIRISFSRLLSHPLHAIWVVYEKLWGLIWISTVLEFRRTESNPEFGIFIYPLAVGQTYKNRWFESVFIRSLLRILKINDPCRQTRETINI